MAQSWIAKKLGVTDAGLDCLCRAVANDGVAQGRGFVRAQGARARLERDGLITAEGPRPTWLITDAGRRVVAAARGLGY